MGERFFVPKSRKIASLALAVAVSITTLLATPKMEVRAASASGSCGANVTWTLSDSGVLTLSGTGDMTNATGTGKSQFYAYRNSIKSIVVEDGITSVGDWAFEYCKYVTSVSLPSTLKTIGRQAFADCYELTEVDLPLGLTSISSYAFSDCKKLATMTVPDSVIEMESGVFFRDSALEEVVLSRNVEVLSRDMFELCTSLRKVQLPANLTTIKDRVFADCYSLEEVVIPKKVTTIERDVFDYSGIKHVIFRANVDTIPADIFYGCSSLENVEIYNSATEIDCAAFRGCTSLKNITIPDTINFVQSNAFAECTSLKSVTIHGDNANPSGIRVSPNNNSNFETLVNRATRQPHSPDKASCSLCENESTAPAPSPMPGQSDNPFADDFAPAMIEKQVVYPNSTVNPSTLHCQFYHQNGKSYWYENGVRQGTLSDPKGVYGFGTNRGREICDLDTAAWYWCDSEFNGAKAINKEVWMPYIYQDEKSWSSYEIKRNAAASIDSHADMSAQLGRDISAHTGKWVRYNANGKMFKGWYKVTSSEAQYYPDQVGNIYYYDPKTGLMAKGYLAIDGVTYHFDEISGVLQR